MAFDFQEDSGGARLVEAARVILADFFESDPGGLSSVVVIDVGHRVCLRYDGDPALEYMLNSAGMLVGSDAHESRLGTSAGHLCLLTGVSECVVGPEHWNDELVAIAEAASPIRDLDGSVFGVVVVINHLSEHSSMAVSVSRFLAKQIHELVVEVDQRRTGSLAACFASKTQSGNRLVLATDGTHLFTHTASLCPQVARRDFDGLVRHARSALLNGDFGSCRIALSGGGNVDVDLEPVVYLGEVTGCVLTASSVTVSDMHDGGGSTSRQGAHVGSVGPRDYTTNLTGDNRRVQRTKNQSLLNPYLRARQAVAVSISEHRNQLLVGEAGTGKCTMAAAMFTSQYPGAAIETVNCARLDVSAALDRLSASVSDRASHRLLVLRSLNSLNVNDARALNNALLILSKAIDPPMIIGCVDATAVDQSHPYALVGAHFREVTRIPALRHRVDDIADIARSILREISTRHSLRLGMQVVRVFEGYSWPGNISELKDVLRHVVANKPFGEIQSSDLPRLHFRDATRKLSPLDTAQCDTIIQALYEVGGNRYDAAALLGISRSSLYRKIDAFGISYIG